MQWILLVFLASMAACDWPSYRSGLEGERSLFLQASQEDAILWRPWAPEVIAEARKKDRLIFLSIGYASCFACEEMQTEVYSQSDIADLLNASFVSIKVDRDERPDVDLQFLNMQSLIMGFGAWPINMILTPDLQPVFATTRTKKAELLQILLKSKNAWNNERQEILTGVKKYQQHSAVQESNHPPFEKDQSLIKDFYARYTHQFDTLYGGKAVGGRFQTKFPVNDDMRLLLRYYRQTKEPQALKMVEKTMSTVAKSAMFDHLSGGFHRYSSSRDWNTPNYEKTLIDQASFLNAYIDLYSAKPNDLYRKTMEKTVAFLLSTLQADKGGFYNSQSSNIGKQEGLFYTWQPHEVQAALKPNEWQVFNEFYSFSTPMRRFQNRRGLRKKTSFQRDDIENVEEVLHRKRLERGFPTIDTKVVTADSAAALSALARLQRLWPSDSFYKVIQSNMDKLVRQHRSFDGDLYRRSIGGEVKHQGILDDYAFLIDALIELYQSHFDEKYLVLANELQKRQIQNFWNPKKKLFAFNLVTDPFIAEQFSFNDQTRVSGQAMSYWNLIRLTGYFANRDYQQKAQQLLDSYPDLLKTDPLSYPSLLLGLDFTIAGGKHIIVVGDKNDCREQATQAFKGLSPYVLWSCIHSKSQVPLHVDKPSLPGKTTFYVCSAKTCEAPSADWNDALSLLKERNDSTLEN